MVLVGMVTIIFPDQLGIAANSNPVSLRKETIKPEGVDILAKPRTIQGNELVIMLKGMMDNMSHVFYLVQNLNGKAKVECRPKNNSFIPLPKTVVERFLETIGKKTLSLRHVWVNPTPNGLIRANLVIGPDLEGGPANTNMGGLPVTGLAAWPEILKTLCDF